MGISLLPRCPAESGNTLVPVGAAAAEWIRTRQVVPGCVLPAVATVSSDVVCQVHTSE